MTRRPRKTTDNRSILLAFASNRRRTKTRLRRKTVFASATFVDRSRTKKISNFPFRLHRDWTESPSSISPSQEKKNTQSISRSRSFQVVIQNKDATDPEQDSIIQNKTRSSRTKTRHPEQRDDCFERRSSSRRTSTTDPEQDLSFKTKTRQPSTEIQYVYRDCLKVRLRSEGFCLHRPSSRPVTNIVVLCRLRSYFPIIPTWPVTDIVPCAS